MASFNEGGRLKFLGSILLLSGWLLVLAALVLLPSFAERLGFIVAGILVEVLGLVLVTRTYTAEQRRPSKA